MWKRVPPTRWLRIASWTIAALTWATTALMAQSATEAREAVQSIPQVPDPQAASSLAARPTPLPAAPDDGLVILRYTPIPPPPPEVVVRTVVVGGAAQQSQAPSVSSAGS